VKKRRYLTIQNLIKIMKKEDIRKYREEKWIRDSLLLRDKTPSQSLKVFCNLVNSMSKLNKVKK